MTDLSKRGNLDRFHQLGKNVATGNGRFLKTLERRRCLVLVELLKCLQVVDLLFFLLFGRPGQFARNIEALFVSPRVEKGVDPDDRQFTIMLLVFVKHRFILNSGALILGLHGSQYPAALVDALEFGHNRLFHQIGQLLNYEGTLQ